MADYTNSQADSSKGWYAFFQGLGPSGRAGVLLVVAAVVAFAWANSPWAASYNAIWNTPVIVGAGSFALEKPLLLWINDGLMAVFFLLVGLEIKRELLDGALSTVRKAALPMFAAIGGIFVPAGIYFAINMQGGDPAGWPIPAATDIAFALGILALLGKRVPIELKVFLTAVAIVDDLGAILIVAAFLTDKVVLLALGAAAGVIVLLSVLNRSGVRHPVPYALLGIILWLAVLKSGVHATVAGVALAATIPAGRAITLPLFVSESSDAIGLGEREDGDEMPPDTAVHRVRELANKVESPLIRWEHGLQPYVLYGVMPIFALANAGVSVGGEAASQGLGPVGWGVALGLLLGKPIGVTLGAWLGVKTGFCALPQGVSWGQIHAASWLAGIGFTMSLFISNLALTGPSATAAKLGLLLGSVLAGIIGVILLIRTCPKDVTHEVGPSLP